jgi:hypothetical protein
MLRDAKSDFAVADQQTVFASLQSGTADDGILGQRDMGSGGGEVAGKCGD